MNTKTLLSLLFAATIFNSSIAYADIAPPPEEEACASLMEGDACSFVPWSADDEVTGTCQGGFCIADGDAEAGEETPAAGDDAPAAGDDAPAAGDGAPVAGDGAPAAGDGAPAAGDGAPAAGDDAPAAGDDAPAGNVDSDDSEEGGCDQRSSRGQGALLALFALLTLVVRRRAIDA